MRYALVIVGLLLGFAGLIEVNKLTLGNALLICGTVLVGLGVVASYVHRTGEETKAAVKDASVSADACRVQVEAVREQLMILNNTLSKMRSEMRAGSSHGGPTE